MELQELYYKMMSKQEINLRPKQSEAYSLMAQGESIFLTGMAGTGKTKVIKMFAENYGKTKKIAITSTTGTSALLIDGVTLHSYTGIGLGKGSVEAITKLIFKRSWLRKRWNDLEILIIDEISMLSPELFDKLEEIARIVRRNPRPFGGIQLILSGDYCQLPCIGSNKFCNHATSWDSCIKHIIYLNEILRQNDPVFQNCLNHIRLGETTPDVIEILQSRVGVLLKNEYGITPTKLYPLNYAVDHVNQIELDKLALETDPDFFEYDMEITIYKSKNRAVIEDKFKKYCTAPVTLQLCVGAQVVLLYNMDLGAKLANGSRGIVVRFINDLPVVKFLDGTERIIDYHIWEIEENDIKIMQAIQIPLKLAYAISIHMSQGCSLDYAEIDLSEIFEYGQSYVALSRVKSLEGLSLIGLNINKIKAHPEAIEFYRSLL
jgi:ATP-dependent DNA helicase PIF1